MKFKELQVTGGQCKFVARNFENALQLWQYLFYCMNLVSKSCS